MPLWLNLTIGLVLAAIQIFAVEALVPNEFVRNWMHAIGGFLQLAMQIIAHYYNPDGTKAAEPYQGGKQQ